eukprot:1154273-Pelagomonas_calceolata.AAC.3
MKEKTLESKKGPPPLPGARLMSVKLAQHAQLRRYKQTSVPWVAKRMPGVASPISKNSSIGDCSMRGGTSMRCSQHHPRTISFDNVWAYGLPKIPLLSILRPTALNCRCTQNVVSGGAKTTETEDA